MSPALLAPVAPSTPVVLDIVFKNVEHTNLLELLDLFCLLLAVDEVNLVWWLFLLPSLPHKVFDLL